MSFKSDDRFLKAIEAFDTLNAQDPNTVSVGGTEQAKELHDALAMTRWIETMYPDANEVVHLAARCQHLCRWESPRDSYPEGRVGYLKWRSDLKQMHADKSAEVLRELGYASDVIEAVVTINLKKGLKSNPDVQAIEDALCLVFLELQFEGYLDKWADDKIIGILQNLGENEPGCARGGHEIAVFRARLELGEAGPLWLAGSGIRPACGTTGGD